MDDASPELHTASDGAHAGGPSPLEVAALQELDSLSLKEILDEDSRPTFVLDLDPDFIDDTLAIRPVFCNAALNQHSRLLDSIVEASEECNSKDFAASTYDEFRIWATGISRFNNSKDIFPLTILYQGLLWTGSTIRQRWRIISGNALYRASDIPKSGLSATLPLRPAIVKRDSEAAKARKASAPVTSALDVAPTARQAYPKSETASAVASNPFSKITNTSSNASSLASSITIQTREDVTPDFTVAQPKGKFMDPHIMFIRSIDWASTPLGQMDTWSSALREVVNLLIRSPYPTAMFWGEELTVIYNEAYKVEVAGNKHPELMGTGMAGPFAEVWDGIAPVFKGCADTGRASQIENDHLPLERFGYLEECFFSWSITPMYGGTDKILGFYNIPFETTYQVVSTRRMQTLRYLSERLSATRTVKEFWLRLLEGLEHNPIDVPFALLYSIVDNDDADTASHSSDSTISLKSCLLEGSIGIPAGHPASPRKLDLKRSQEGFVPAFREAMRTREPTTLQTRDGTLPESLLEGIEWRGYGDPCKEAIIFPVRPTNGEQVFAFLLVGVQPRRAYDDEYKAFAAQMNRQLATSLASVMLFEDEMKRSRSAFELAQVQREQLSKELALQTSRMRRMTELSPLGMYLFDPDGMLLEGNDRYFEMTGHPREGCKEFSFLELMAEESKGPCQDMWDDLHETKQTCVRELQVNNSHVQPRDLSGNPIEYWVMSHSSPEIGPDGEILSIMGSITDISQIKWAQGLQETRLREAEETKRQQNEFIDITSHEMRNPLSAILICSDDIRDTLTQHGFSKADEVVVADCIEAANNIALCVQHQKSIVDDILTVSKLDSNLLLITPVPAQPIAVVQRAMNMFKPEVQAKSINFTFHPDPSLTDLNIDWVLLDPSRLLQITVNLITNAIKFTQAEPQRAISVHVSAYSEEPDTYTKDFQFVPTRGVPLLNITTGEDWGTGELLYLRVEVRDTGCGLTPEEKDLLFERFAQASPRTHAHYGGSGLGLFISRQLAELHGGQIGVSSETGVGSTFGFFIQCKRTIESSRPVMHRTMTSQSMDHAEKNRDLAASVAGMEIEQPTPKQIVAELPGTITPRAPAASSAPAPAESGPLHILVVEDNIVNQRVLAKQLRKAGCIVTTADNGLFALAELKKTAYYTPDGVPLSIILMDWEMPEMNGLECAREIRRMQLDGEIQEHVPIIAVTANVRGEQIATARESGMDDVVSKPFRVPELLVKVKDLLETLALEKLD
ncbi:aerobic respiration control sensor protein arcB [Didymella exigua CBS 183.55]|uniref:Aerobic respiration control sensor protein arcB n=1 Tax=Didymella exigua CBS 183.55 TaxID=1150837 RepID=A0A6A5RN43_9PLEO|nr:aerobic respiration control sensor protein arcB [Didymella exigua CBS 183.55]KAF1927776.1 aerobic respiration control sensor protein arcB [Didymella exigua CBS 183.55]